MSNYNRQMQNLLEEQFPDLKVNVTKENVNDVLVNDYMNNGNEIKILYAAVARGRIDLIEYLISLGANYNSESERHRDGLISFAIGMENIDALRILLEAGFDPNYESEFHMHPLVQLFRSQYEYLAKDMIKLCMSYGMDLNYEGPDGIHPIDEFFIYFDEDSSVKYEILKFVFENGMNLSRSRYGWIAQFCSYHYKYDDEDEILWLRTLKLLLDYCVNPNIDFDEHSSLYYSFDDDISLLLLIGGTIVDEKDTLTTIPKFIKENRIKTMTYLVENNFIDFDTKTKYLEIAITYNVTDMINLLSVN